MDYEVVREKLNEITEKGLLAKSIAKRTGLGENELSRFKNGKNCLKRSDLEILSSYLDRVVIPEHF